MSNIAPPKPYIYQPFGIQDKERWSSGRIYGVAHHLLASIDGLTKSESEAVLSALIACVELKAKIQL